MKRRLLLLTIAALVFWSLLPELGVGNPVWAQDQPDPSNDPSALEDGQMNVALLIAIVFPFVFASIELFAGRLLSPPPSQGDRKYMVSYEESGTPYWTYPYDMSALQSLLRKRRTYLDVELMAPQLPEANIGVTLCVGAISTNVVNILIMLSVPGKAPTAWLGIVTVSAFVFEFFSLFIIIDLLRIWSNHRKTWIRIMIAQFSNFWGVILLVTQFFILVTELMS